MTINNLSTAEFSLANIYHSKGKVILIIPFPLDKKCGNLTPDFSGMAFVIVTGQLGYLQKLRISKDVGRGI